MKTLSTLTSTQRQERQDNLAKIAQDQAELERRARRYGALTKRFVPNPLAEEFEIEWVDDIAVCIGKA